MKKIFYIIILLLFSTIHFTSLIFAHPGKTNSDGGHYDKSTGEYHYHNDCSFGTENSLIITDNADNSEISMLRNRISLLEDEIAKLEYQIENNDSDLKDTGYNSISQIYNALNEKKDEVGVLWSTFILLFFCRNYCFLSSCPNKT